MEIWAPRSAAEELLAGPLSKERELLDDLFHLMERQVGHLEARGAPLPGAAAAILGKGYRLSVGLYSLAMDALGQEGGALLRPLQEVSEVLAYLGDDPARISEIQEDRLPRAGVIAKRNDGRLKDLREHLSRHASHFSISADSMGHFLDYKSGTVVLSRAPSSEVLGPNLRSLAAFMTMCVIGGASVMVHSDLAGSAAFMDEASDIRDRLLELGPGHDKQAG